MKTCYFCFSNIYADTEKRYPIIAREGLAILWGWNRFEDYLIDKQFAVVTDHLPLVPLYGEKFIDELISPLQRFRFRLLRFHFNIIYISGQSYCW